MSADGLLEQVRQRQQRDDAVLERRDDAMHRRDRGQHVVVGEHHALRRARRARREDELEDRRPGRASARRRPGPPSPPGRSRPARRRARRGVVVGKAPRPASRGIGRVAAGPDEQPPRLGPGGDPLDRVGRHPQVERDEDDARPHRPEIGGGQLRASTATTSGSGRPARGRAREGATRRCGCAGRARDTTRTRSTRRRRATRAPAGRRTGRAAPSRRSTDRAHRADA